MWLVPRSARLNVVGVEPKGSKCNLENLVFGGSEHERFPLKVRDTPCFYFPDPSKLSPNMGVLSKWLADAISMRRVAAPHLLR